MLSEPEPAVVTAQDVTIAYQYRGQAHISGLTMSLGHEVVALIGRNGAGKSTLIKACLGIARITAGHLSVLGSDVTAHGVPRPLLARIGYLPQDFGTVGTFTVSESVEYAAWLKTVPKAGRADRIANALAAVGLERERACRMSRLSGGTRRRVGIAQAIVGDPELLLLDEPTTGLDPEQRVRFREHIRTIARDRAVLLSTHLVEDVRALANRVVVLDAGRARFTGTVEELELRADEGAPGDTLLERGYLSVLKAAPTT